MCLMAFALRAHPQLGMRLAGNRDEALDRPTAPLSQWTTPDGTSIMAGRDLRDGGTWTGCTADGRVAMLTNVREGPAAATPAQRSRGELVTKWLDAGRTPGLDADAFVRQLDPAAYGGFNLVFGNLGTGQWTWINNRPDWTWPTLPARMQAITRKQPAGWLVATLPPGVYGLSNAGLNTPWPKTRALVQAMTHAVENHNGGNDRLWNALTDRRVAADAELPRTGVPLDWERALSAAFVDVPQHGYGTRTSLLMSITRTHADQPWRLAMTERTHQTGGEISLNSP